MTLAVKELLESIQTGLFERASAFLADNTRVVADYDAFKEIMAGPRGFIEAPWCGDETTEAKRIQDETSATVRCLLTDRQAEGDCVFCGKPAKHVAIFAKAY